MELTGLRYLIIIFSVMAFADCSACKRRHKRLVGNCCDYARAVQGHAFHTSFTPQGR